MYISKDMKFSFIAAQNLVFSIGEMRSEESYFVRNATACLENLPKFGLGVNAWEKAIATGIIRSNGVEGNSGRKRQRLNTYLDKFLTVQIGKLASAKEGFMTIWTTTSMKDYFERMKNTLGGEELLMDIIFDFGAPISDDEPDPLGCVKNESRNYSYRKIKKIESFKQLDRQVEGPAGMVVLLSTSMRFGRRWSKEWMKNTKTFTGELSVNLRLNNNQIGEVFGLGELQNSLEDVNKGLQMDTDLTDVTLVSRDGKEIKCHKIFLTGNSEVFKAMFKAKMIEQQSNIVPVPEMSGEGLHALLDYLYCLDTSKALDSPSVALELLLKAEQYFIESLEREMLQLFHAKKHRWFSVDVAFQLLQFAGRKFDNEGLIVYQYLMRKAGKVLKSNRGRWSRNLRNSVNSSKKIL